MCHFAVPKALIKSPYGFQSCFLSLDLWGQIIFYSLKSFLNYVWQFLVKNLSENEESLRMRFTGFVSCTWCSLHSLHKAEDRECPGNGIQLCFVLLSCQLVWRYLLQQRTQKGSWESHRWLFLLPGAVQMEENVQSKVDAPTGNFSFSSLQVGCVDATRSHSPYFGKCLFPSLFLFALLGVTCVSWCVLTHVNKGDVLYPINTCVISHSCNEGTSKSIASVECSSQYPFSNSVTTCLTQHLN